MVERISPNKESEGLDAWPSCVPTCRLLPGHGVCPHETLSNIQLKRGNTGQTQHSQLVVHSFFPWEPWLLFLWVSFSTRPKGDQLPKFDEPRPPDERSERDRDRSSARHLALGFPRPQLFSRWAPPSPLPSGGPFGFERPLEKYINIYKYIYIYISISSSEIDPL